MKVGIIVHSHTGNTLFIAEKLQQAMKDGGHSVQVERVTAVDPQAKKIELKDVPDISQYDTVIFAAPVWAFSLSPVMALYLKQVPRLEGKAIGCFVSQGLPFPWLGGTRAIRQMVTACEALGGTVYGTGIVNWTNKGKEKGIAQVIEGLGKCGK